MHYEMIFNLLFSLLFVILTFMNLKLIKNYFVKTSISGKLIYVLKKSPSRLLHFGIISLWITYMHIQRVLSNSVIQYPFDIIYFGIEIEIVIFMIIRFLLPQKIYENGILHLWNPGFIEWKEIKKIKITDIKNDQIELVLKQKNLWTDEISLFCLPGSASTIGQYIQQKIDSQ